MKAIVLLFLLVAPCFALDTPQDACVRKGGGLYFVGPTLRKQVCSPRDTPITVLTRKTVPIGSSSAFRTALVGPAGIAFTSTSSKAMLDTDGYIWLYEANLGGWHKLTEFEPVADPIENISEWEPISYTRTDGDVFVLTQGSAGGAFSASYVNVGHP